MRPSCDVISDLLPLYVEGLASADTRQLVEQHLNACNACQRQLAAMQTPKELPGPIAAAPLRKLKGRLLWKSVEGVVLAVTLALIFAIAGTAYLTAPEYLPLSDTLLNWQEWEDGTVLIIFSDEVVGYDAHTSLREDGSGLVYHLTAWTNQWSRLFPPKHPQSLVLKPDGQQTLSVYYYLEGTQDTLIYGEDPHPRGGVITLPRLTLAYYLVLALIVEAGLGILWWASRGHELLKGLLEKLLLLPIAYLLGHLCIKGFRTSTFSLLRDFSAIILITLPIYGGLLLVSCLYHKYRLLQQTEY
jgi:hypothetical protein